MNQLIVALVTIFLCTSAAAQSGSEALQRARAFENAKQYDQAMVVYQEYLTARPDDDAARGALARLLSWAGRYDEAAALYQDILIRRPADLDVRVSLARVKSWQKKFTEAQALYEKALEEDPRNLEAKRGLADTFYWGGNYASAMRLYEDIYATTQDLDVAKQMESVRTEMAIARRTLPYREYFKFGYAHYTYSNNTPDERGWLLEAAKPLGDQTVVARIEILNRFKKHDAPLSAELYSPLWNGAWGYIGFGATASPHFSTKLQLGGEVSQGLGILQPNLSFLEPSFGFRWMSFSKTKVEILIPGLTLYLPWDVWLTEKAYYVPDNNTTTISSQITWQMNDRLRYFVSAAFGRSAEQVGILQDITRVSSRTFRSGLIFPLASQLSAEASGYYEDRKTLYIRRGGNFNLIFYW